MLRWNPISLSLAISDHQTMMSLRQNVVRDTPSDAENNQELIILNTFIDNTRPPSHLNLLN